jgi:hypothetical protein
VNFAFAVCCAVDGVVVDGDEAGVAGELEIGLDEGGAERDGAAEGGQSVFGRVAGGASMSDYEHGYARSSLRCRATKLNERVL